MAIKGFLASSLTLPTFSWPNVHKLGQRFELHLLCLLLIGTLANAAFDGVNNVPGISSEKHELSLKDKLIFISTLNGWLKAVDPWTGDIKWALKEEPVVRVPVEVKSGFTFLPDPQDGSLYLLREGRLKKLPFTIPQLVQASPCKSNDGVLYAGSKKDVWIGLDVKTGTKLEILSQDSSIKTCPVSSSSDGASEAGSDKDKSGRQRGSNQQAVFIGRTEYSISMYDAASRDRKWNGTFMDYSSHVLPEDLNYALHHFSSSGDGRILTVDEESGEVLWDRDYGTPIVAMYILQGDGLHRLPFTVIGNETLNTLIDDGGQTTGKGNHPYVNKVLHSNLGTEQKKLYPTLYVGETENGLYAIPSLVDEKTVTIAPKNLGPPLLTGPTPLDQGVNGEASDGDDGDRVMIRPDIRIAELKDKTSEGEILLLGYHETPETARQEVIQDSNILRPRWPGIGYNPSSSSAYIPNIDGSLSSENGGGGGGPSTAANPNRNYVDGVKTNNQYLPPFLAGSGRGMAYESRHHHQPPRRRGEPGGEPTLLRQLIDELTDLVDWKVITACVSVFAGLLYYLCKRPNQNNGYNSAQSSNAPSYSGSNINNNGVVKINNGGSSWWSSAGKFGSNVPDGWIPIGKMMFNPQHVLGRGCEGTVVYKGEFDGRPVAVKRVVSEFLNLADREVSLLRESDMHPNVIRYFCMESDSQFRYIALELCTGTLADWVESRELRQHIAMQPSAILYQATYGLAYLHSIKIELVWAPVNGSTKVFVVDENLVLKSLPNRDIPNVVVSRRSGVAGTDGWIAPEVLKSETSVTTSVDVFSLGCVFYYVVTLGQHPFGDSLRRQANILSEEFTMKELPEDDHVTANGLILKMLNKTQSERPSANKVLKHPFFWDRAKILAFFQDVSDRVEKEDMSSPVLRSLERGNRFVVKNDWRQHICPALQADLRKFRTYRGNSVRDLLRALRNKKHHYRELPPEVQHSLGTIPGQFVHYFTSRFPHLVRHAYDAMECVATEGPFAGYYEVLPYGTRSDSLTGSPKGAEVVNLKVPPPNPPDDWEDKTTGSIERLIERKKTERGEDDRDNAAGGDDGGNQAAVFPDNNEIQGTVLEETAQIKSTIIINSDINDADADEDDNVEAGEHPKQEIGNEAEEEPKEPSLHFRPGTTFETNKKLNLKAKKT